MRTLLALALVVACSRTHERAAVPKREDAAVQIAHAPSPKQPDVLADGPIEHRVTCGAVTAIWRGERDEGLDKYSELWFELASGKPPVQATTGDMFATDWAFDIFSPDCKHVLLLQSHTGPYHIVQARRLADYLRGGKPDHLLAGTPDPKGVTGTGVFHAGAWVSTTEVTYQWGCCDPPIVATFKLPQ